MSDLPAVFRQYTRKAKKEHQCCECRRPIMPGSHYQYSSGIWDGSAHDYKQCLNCSLVFNSATDISDEYDFPCFTGLGEWLGNYFHQGYDRSQSIRDISRDLKLEEEVIEYAFNGRFSS